MGTVYRARDLQLGRDVAVKVLREGLSDSVEAQARFRREVATLAGLSHPRLVRIFEAELDASPPFFVMELLEGEPLSSRLERGSPLGPAEVRRLLEQLAEGLEYLHGRGIVHRDLKPSNVFVGPDGSFRLLDLGLARAADRTALTAAGALVGTVAYLPPEVLRGSAFTPRGDVYQAGLVTALAAGLRHPYERGGTGRAGPAAMLRALSSGEHVAPDLDERALGPLAPLVRLCCALEPDRRPADGAELRRALGADPPAASPARRTAGDAPRRFVPAALVGVLVVALLGLVALPRGEAPRPPTQSPTATRPAPGAPAAVELARAEPAEDGSLFLHLRSAGDSSLRLRLRGGRSLVPELRRGPDGSIRVRLPGPAEDVLGLEVEGRGGLGGSLAAEVTSLAGPLGRVDMRALTRDLSQELSESLPATALELETLMGKAEPPAAPERGEEETRVDDVRQRWGALLTQRLAASGSMDSVRRACALAPAVLGTGLVAPSTRRAFYGALTPWVELRCYLDFQRVEVPALPALQLGPYGPRTRSSAGLWGGPGTSVQTTDLTSGPPVRLRWVGGDGLTLSRRFLDCVFELPRVGQVRLAEVRLDLLAAARVPLVLSVNAGAPLVVGTWHQTTASTPQLLYQTLPLELLREGANALRVRFDPLLGRVTLSRQHIDVKRLTLTVVRGP